jgi:rhodanese-related sulfurtransferase
LTTTTEELKRLVAAGAASMVDFRSPAEFAIGHIPGSVNIPLEQIQSRIADIPERRLVLICEGGKRAQLVADWLQGVRETTVLDGGMGSWRKAGLPTLACAPCRWSLERQVRFGAGVVVLLGSLLTTLISSHWVYLTMFVGAGLTFAGVTNVCGMAKLLAKMPWNSQIRTRSGVQSAKEVSCCT